MHSASTRRGVASGFAPINNSGLEAIGYARLRKIGRAAVPITPDHERPIERSKKSAKLMEYLHVSIFALTAATNWQVDTGAQQPSRNAAVAVPEEHPPISQDAGLQG